MQKNQNPDGSWGQKHKAGMTGLALLTYLSNGELNGGPFSATINRGLSFLVKTVEADKVNESRSYGYGIALLALTEAYGMSSDPMLKAAVERGVKRVIAGQNDNGGFDYYLKVNERNDLSLSSWFFQALKAAEVAGIQVPGLKQALEKSKKMIKNSYRVQQGEGTFSYTSTTVSLGSRHSMRAVGTYNLLRLGEEQTLEAKSCLRVLLNQDLETLMHSASTSPDK